MLIHLFSLSLKKTDGDNIHFFNTETFLPPNGLWGCLEIISQPSTDVSSTQFSWKPLGIDSQLPPKGSPSFLCIPLCKNIHHTASILFVCEPVSAINFKILSLRSLSTIMHL